MGLPDVPRRPRFHASARLLPRVCEPCAAPPLRTGRRFGAQGRRAARRAPRARGTHRCARELDLHPCLRRGARTRDSERAHRCRDGANLASHPRPAVLGRSIRTRARAPRAARHGATRRASGLARDDDGRRRATAMRAHTLPSNPRSFCPNTRKSTPARRPRSRATAARS